MDNQSEIKFRLRIDNKIVGYEKWYGGKKLTDEDPTGAEPCWLYSEDNKYWNPKYIYHKQKDLFTDRHDKNRKEIYTGDIVKNARSATVDFNEIDIREVVELKDGAFYPVSEMEDEKFEVIGDIYSNPELLTK